MHYDKLKYERLQNIQNYIIENPQIINNVMPKSKMYPIFYCFQLKYFVQQCICFDLFLFLCY